ncbi:MAG: LacI family DNA-binding transcriptional regulator [Actinobacteria bacterium]|nr:LacI family DNA-binding transcriptional regulator [Actinomycetota bacterium]
MPTRPPRVTLRDIAAATGLSTAAVSYALRGLQVPIETQQRVRDVADRLGYQVDPIARALSSGRTGYIGVLCGSLEDIWQQSLAARLGRGLLSAGRHALIVDASNDPALESSLAMQLVDQRVDALIALPVDPRGEHWAKVAERTVLVSIGDGIPTARTSAEVVFDNETGVSEALRLLAGAGHRRIAVLTSTSLTTPDRPAEVVVHRVAAELRLRTTVHVTPHDLAGACAVAHDLLSSPDRPTAFFCLADSMAYGVYAAVRELGLRVPDDASVLGYDDHAVSSLLTPPLSSFRWPVEELVESVVARTVRAIEDDRRSRRKVLTPTAQVRGSISARGNGPRTRSRPIRDQPARDQPARDQPVRRTPA